MPACRRAADRRVPQRAAMAGRYDKRPARLCTQGFQRVQEVRIVPVLAGTEPPAAAAGQLSNAEMRPVPVRDTMECV